MPTPRAHARVDVRRQRHPAEAGRMGGHRCAGAEVRDCAAEVPPRAAGRAGEARATAARHTTVSGRLFPNSSRSRCFSDHHLLRCPRHGGRSPRRGPRRRRRRPRSGRRGSVDLLHRVVSKSASGPASHIASGRSLRRQAQLPMNSRSTSSCNIHNSQRTISGRPPHHTRATVALGPTSFRGVS